MLGQVSITFLLRGESINLDNKVYEKLTSVSSHVWNKLFSNGEDDFRNKRMTNVYKLFGRYQDLERMFLQFRDHSYTSDGKYKGG